MHFFRGKKFLKTTRSSNIFTFVKIWELLVVFGGKNCPKMGNFCKNSQGLPFLECLWVFIFAAFSGKKQPVVPKIEKKWPGAEIAIFATLKKLQSRPLFARARDPIFALREKTALLARFLSRSATHDFSTVVVNRFCRCGGKNVRGIRTIRWVASARGH